MVETEKKLTDMQFEFNGGVVTVYYFKTRESKYHQAKDASFSYKGVGSDSVKTLDSNLYSKIILAIDEFENKYEEIQKERVEVEKQKRIEQAKIWLEKFKLQILQEIPELLNLNPRFKDLESIHSESDAKYVRFDGATIQYHSNYHSNRNWEVDTGIYHKYTKSSIYYGTLIKAGKKAVELIEAHKEAVKCNGERQQKEEFFASAIAKIAQDNNLKVEGYNNNYYFIPTNNESYNADFKLYVSDFDGTPCITEIEISIPVTMFKLKTKNITIKFESPVNCNEIKKIIQDIHNEEW